MRVIVRLIETILSFFLSFVLIKFLDWNRFARDRKKIRSIGMIRSFPRREEEQKKKKKRISIGNFHPYR